MEKPFRIACCFIFFLSASTSYAEKQLVLNTTGKAPLNTTKNDGFMDLIAKEAFQRINVKLKTIQLPAERGLKNANAGIDDGEMSRVAGLEKFYPNLIRVPEKIMDWHFVAFSKKNIKLTNGWRDLMPYSIAYINGWKILEKNINFPGVITVRDPEQLFNLLNKNRTDVIVYEQWGGLYLTKINNMKSIKIQKPALASKAMFIYLHKKHLDLIQPLANALKTMKNDGSYQQIVKQILSPLEL